MNPEEKLYSLLAHAEDSQSLAKELLLHAEKLQNKASDAFSALPLAVEQAGKEIRSTGLVMVFFLFAVGIVASSIAVAGIWWGTSQLRDEAAELRTEVRVLEAQAKEFRNKAGKAVLSSCGERGKGRLCIRVDERAGRYGDSQSGLFMVIDGY